MVYNLRIIYLLIYLGIHLKFRKNKLKDVLRGGDRNVDSVKASPAKRIMERLFTQGHIFLEILNF